MIQIRNLTKNDRKKLAVIHTDDMLRNYSKEIEYSINYSRIYTRNNLFSKDNNSMINTNDEINITEFLVTENDTVTELFLIPRGERIKDERVAVLNFASYKNPGGRYYDGSSAQEEFVCHHSTLYPVLNAFSTTYYAPHKSTLNRALYTDTAIYSTDILFFDYELTKGDRSSNLPYKELGILWADVITCAAPNRSAFERYQCTHPLTEETKKLLYDTMYHRCEMVLEVAKLNGVRCLILGAFGCGVFGNDPKQVAEIFARLLNTTYAGAFKEVRFAIPKGSDRNHEVFKEVFNR